VRDIVIAQGTGCLQKESEMAPASGIQVSDTGNKFEDLSGIEIKPDENPYDALINACDGCPVSRPLLQLPRKGSRERMRGCGREAGGRKGSSELEWSKERGAVVGKDRSSSLAPGTPGTVLSTAAA
jgi:hypothetical protein